jgi:hypothetical protein
MPEMYGKETLDVPNPGPGVVHGLPGVGFKLTISGSPFTFKKSICNASFVMLRNSWGLEAGQSEEAAIGKGSA